MTTPTIPPVRTASFLGAAEGGDPDVTPPLGTPRVARRSIADGVQMTPRGLLQPIEPQPAAEPKENPASSSDTSPALQGLRGFGCLLVVIGSTWVLMPSGFVGSLGLAGGPFRAGGFGIIVLMIVGAATATGQLAARRQRAGTADHLIAFWRERLTRLVPSLLAVVSITTVVAWSGGFVGSSPSRTLASALSAVTFTYNQVLLQNPLVARADLGHTWYLAVEQQWLLIWAPLVWVAARRTRFLLGIALLGSGIVAANRFVVSATDWWWPASFRLTTRSDALFIGAAVALSASLLPAAARPRRWTAAALAVMAAVVMTLGRAGDADLGWRGVVFAVATGAAVLGLIGTTGTGTRTASVLAARPLRAIGARWLPLFLWHLPVFYAAGRWAGEWPTVWRLLLAASMLTVAVAATTLVIERPIERRLGARSAVDVLPDRVRYRRAVLAGAAAGAVPFVLTLWDWGLNPLRTALTTRLFSNFNDVQARALLDGRLDVPAGALSIEAFRIDGREFMYFPPFPALLRTPILAVTDGWDGRLSAPSMALAWVVVAVATAGLVWQVRAHLREDAPWHRRELWMAGGFVGLVAGGSIITYLASLPWVYHEAYMWSSAGTLGSLWMGVALLRGPSWRRVVGAAVFASITVLTRTTTGWAMCAMFIAIAVFLRVRREGRPALWIGSAAAGLVPLSAAIAFNWAKFRHPFMFPLADQVWTELNAHRREALDHNDGSLTGPQFLPTTLWAYLRPDGIRFTSVFPYVTLPAGPPGSIGGAFVDQSYRTGSVVAFMPLLSGLSLVGGLLVARGRQAARLRIPALAAVGITIGVLCYGYIAHRYTAEFLPGLVILGAVGAMYLTDPDRVWQPRTARSLIAATCVLGVFGVLANTATGLDTARTTARGEGLSDYVGLRARLDPGPSGSRVRQLSGDAPTDAIEIVGDCDAVYLATGDQYSPWAAVALRGATVVLNVLPGREHAVPARMVLARFVGHNDRELAVTYDGDGNYQLSVTGGGSNDISDWYFLAADADVPITITADAGRQEYVVEHPVMLTATVPTDEWDPDWVGVPVRLELTPPDPDVARSLDLTVTFRRPPPPEVCDQLG